MRSRRVIKTPAELEADQKDAIWKAISLWDSNPVVFDTETTGLNDAEIIEIAAVSVEGEVLIDSLVKPLGPIEKSASDVHGITLEDVADAPTIADLMPKLHEVMTGRPVTSYNLGFDSTMMRQSCGKRQDEAWNAYEWLRAAILPADCIMEIYAQWYGNWNDYHASYTWDKLEVAAKNLLVPVPDNKHRALADAQMALGVLRAVARWEGQDE